MQGASFHAAHHSAARWRAGLAEPIGVYAGGLTEQSWREGLAELSTLLARSRAQWKIVVGAHLVLLGGAYEMRLGVAFSGHCVSTDAAGTAMAVWQFFLPRLLSKKMSKLWALCWFASTVCLCLGGWLVFGPLSACPSACRLRQYAGRAVYILASDACGGGF